MFVQVAPAHDYKGRNLSSIGAEVQYNGRLGSGARKKTPSWSHCRTYKRSLYQDRLGTNIRKAQGKAVFAPAGMETPAAFAELMAGLGLAYPKKLDVAVPANMICGV